MVTTFQARCFRSCLRSLLLPTLLVLTQAVNSTAQAQVTINFDSLNASTGDADPTSYLAGYGITVTLGPNSKLVVESDIVFPYLHPTTEHNFLALLRTANPQVDSATLNFATPLSSISFDRIAATGLLTPQWSATAYDAEGHAVGSVGESFGNGWSTPVTYTISGSGIKQLTLSGKWLQYRWGRRPNVGYICANACYYVSDFALFIGPSVWRGRWLRFFHC